MRWRFRGCSEKMKNVRVSVGVPGESIEKYRSSVTDYYNTCRRALRLIGSVIHLTAFSFDDAVYDDDGLHSDRTRFGSYKVLYEGRVLTRTGTPMLRGGAVVF